MCESFFLFYTDDGRLPPETCMEIKIKITFELLANVFDS